MTTSQTEPAGLTGPTDSTAPAGESTVDADRPEKQQQGGPGPIKPHNGPIGHDDRRVPTN
jgi:hypothetical protein